VHLRRGMTTQPSLTTGFDSVTEYECFDHRRLDALLRKASADALAGAGSARASCEAFEQALTRHIRIEEQVLFPLFETRIGIMGGPTETLRQEHREIQHAAALMRAAIARNDVDAFRDACAFLQGALAPHHSKEEHVLYPTTDRALSDAERAMVLERLLRE
jgi:hemerythrin-like domain-containing protein